MIYFYISLLTYFVYTFLKYKQSLQILKKEKYDTKKYLKEIKKSNYYINKEISIIILIIIAINLDLKTIEITTIILYTILSLFKLKEKINLKVEKKIITRIILESIIFILLNIWFILDYRSYHHTKGLIFDNSSLYYIILYLFTYASYFVTLTVNVLVKPFDKVLK